MFGLGPSPRAGPDMGCTAKAAPRNTPVAGATLVENGTSVAPGYLQAPQLVGTALVALGYMALAGTEPDQAPPRRPPIEGGALERQVA